jgi:hypothetical protein
MTEGIDNLKDLLAARQLLPLPRQGPTEDGRGSHSRHRLRASRPLVVPRTGGPPKASAGLPVSMTRRKSRVQGATSHQTLSAARDEPYVNEDLPGDGGPC